MDFHNSYADLFDESGADMNSIENRVNENLYQLIETEEYLRTLFKQKKRYLQEELLKVNRAINRIQEPKRKQFLIGKKKFIKDQMKLFQQRSKVIAVMFDDKMNEHKSVLIQLKGNNVLEEIPAYIR